MSKKNHTTPVAEQGLLPLTYAPIGETASRDTIRSLTQQQEAKRGRESYFIRYDIIRWREGLVPGQPGFNGRIRPVGISDKEWEQQLDIETLAMDLLENGHNEPLKGDLNKDATIFWLTDGERRFRAIGWLLRNNHTHYANGKEIAMVEVILNARDTTEEQRLLLMMSTDSKLKYKPIEMAHMLYRLKANFGYAHDRIAKIRNISRQTVDNLIKLAQEPQIIQDAIISEKLSPTAAIELINTYKDDVEKRIARVQEMLAGGAEIKVKDVKQEAEQQKKPAAPAMDYHAMMAAVIERFNDGLITYDKAVQDIKQIEIDALAKFAEKSTQQDIKDTTINSLEVLDNNEAIRKAEGQGEKETPFERTEQPYDALFKAAVQEYSDNKVDYLDTTKAICKIGLEATKEHPELEADIEEREKAALQTVEQLKKFKDKNAVKVVDTQAADEKAQQAGVTSASYREPSRSEKQGDDALEAIDFKKDKELGEMELNEAIKMCDKLETNLNALPEGMKQYKADWQGLVNQIRYKITQGIEVIKKAADTR